MHAVMINDHNRSGISTHFLRAQTRGKKLTCYGENLESNSLTTFSYIGTVVIGTH